jgi:hypothetical protein
MTVEKIKFHHRCIEEKEVKESSSSNQNLSAFERFKLTPAYKEILKRQGKLQEESPAEVKIEPNLVESSPASKKNKRLTKRQEKIQISKEKEDKLKE